MAVLAGATLALRPRPPGCSACTVRSGCRSEPRPTCTGWSPPSRSGPVPEPGPALLHPDAYGECVPVGGRDDAAIGVTDGLPRHLSGREVAGVLAPEISHVRSDGLWVMTLADMVGRFTHALAYVGLLLLVVGLPLLAAGTVWPAVTALALTTVPTVVTLLQLALSRSGEYDADLEAAGLTGDPAVPPTPCCCGPIPPRRSGCAACRR